MAAASVRYLLEESVPELEALVENKVFTRDEVRSIVRKRQGFEYALQRRAPVLEDYRRYVQFEADLNKLRRHRVATAADAKESRSERAGQVGKLAGGHAFTRRIHFIYQRALNKFKGDLSLWLEYFTFCRSQAGHGGRILARALARCLRLHPRVPGLWAYASAWEYDDRGNATAARALMQRGLRLNKTAKTLWAEYFRLECLYALKLRTRRELLAAKLGGGGGGGGGDAPPREGEDGLSAQQAILDGTLAVAVIKGAARAFPDDSGALLSFVDVLVSLPAPLPLVTDALYDALSTSYASDDNAAVAVAVQRDTTGETRGHPHLEALWQTRQTSGVFAAASKHLRASFESSRTDADADALLACLECAVAALDSKPIRRWAFAKPLSQLQLERGDVPAAAATLAREVDALARTRIHADVAVPLLGLVATADAAGMPALVAAALPQDCDVGDWLESSLATLVASGAASPVEATLPAFRLILEWCVARRRADVAVAAFRHALTVHLRGGANAVVIEPVLRTCASITRLIDDAEGAEVAKEATRLREEARRRLDLALGRGAAL